MQATGRCLCGTVRYALTAETTSVLECHCSMCRRQSGSSSLVYALYRRDDVSISHALQYYRASDSAKRGFCSNCGSPVSYEDDDDRQFIWLTVGTHDDPGSLPTREHVYVEDKIAWMEIADHLRQWSGERGGPRGE